MERPKRLSQAFIKGVKVPGRYSDGRGSYGLSLMVKSSADGGLSKSFTQQLRRRDDRTTVNVGLGSTESTTLQAAREAAIDNFRDLRDGKEIRRRRVAEEMCHPHVLPLAKTAPTLREVTEKWIELSRQNWKADKTERLNRQRLENHVPTLMDAPVDSITRKNILDALLLIHSISTRDRVRKCVHSIMGHAVLREWRTDNPADDALRAALSTGRKQQKHHPTMASSEITVALAKADARGGWVFAPLALRFVALTACRSGEVRGARWDEFDVDDRVWHVPAERMKASRAFDVPLSVPALNVLQRAEELADGSGLVFPSSLGKPMDSSRLSETLSRSYGGSTVHGLRASFRTWAAEQGIERDVSEMVLAHALGTATELAYQRSDFFKRRVEVMERWAAVVEGLEPQGQTAAA